MRSLLRAAPLAALLLSTPALAQQSVVSKSFSTQLFEPAMGTRDLLFTVEGATVADHLGFGVGVVFNYQHRPLVIQREEREGVPTEGFSPDSDIAVVENQLSANVVGAVGFRFGWFKLQVGLDMPVNLLTRGTNVDAEGKPLVDADGSATVTAVGAGDLKMQIKLLLLDDWHGLSVALSPVITFPTGDKDNFGGDPNVSVRPRAVASWRFGRLLLAANVGYLIRENTAIFSSEVGDQLMYGAGVGFAVHPRVQLIAELFGRAGFGTASDCRQVTGPDGQPRRECAGTSAIDADAFPLELDAGARISLGSGVKLLVGGGVGLHRAIGTPVARALLGVAWAPDFRDTDRDGIYDRDDRCVTQPEDKDGFRDEDGCPDLDNDEDLLPDVKDKCPDEPEDKDGFQDEDGCPEKDNDGDGIDDIHDECPFKPETKNGFKDEDGCPDEPDGDGDGVVDAKDKCPKEKEDKDGFQDEDGCADPDNDEDGVPDGFDDCPLKPEDMDGFEDDDGCPDLDNDRDGVPDVADQCPTKPETINGIKDDDGCPDKGKPKVVVKADKIVILDKIYFDTGRATIKRRSYDIISQVALVLRAHPEIQGVRIEGHTDSRGDPERNRALSKARAEAVRKALIQYGVDASRLVAVGRGADAPIASNRTRKGRSENRRVEFIILDKPPAAAR